MSYTLKQAADATGKSKPTILRAIQSGKMSAHKDQNGEWQIDPAELHRVYDPATKTDTRNDTSTGQATPHEIMMLRQELEFRYEQLANERRERERERETITELRRQLTVMDEERRMTLRQLTALLTDQREKAQPAPSQESQSQQITNQNPRRPFRAAWLLAAFVLLLIVVVTLLIVTTPAADFLLGWLWKSPG